MKNRAQVVGVLVAAGAVAGFLVYWLQPPRLTERTLRETMQAQRQFDETRNGIHSEPSETISDEMEDVMGEEPENVSETGAAAPQPEDGPPDVFKVEFECSNGAFVIECRKDWAPRGVARFYELVKQDFFTDMRFFRVVRWFVVQFGIAGDPQVSRQWRNAAIKDDPVKQSNTRGSLTFATSGPDSRTTQFFINLADNTNLDNMGFAPIGKVVSGMDVVAAINGEYGEAPSKRQPDIQRLGNAFLDQNFPNLDYIKKATLLD